VPPLKDISFWLTLELVIIVDFCCVWGWCSLQHKKGGKGASWHSQRAACWLTVSTYPLSVINLLVNFFLPVWSFSLPLLTYSVVHSPSWEANWFATSQEIPRISRNPKVHYSTHKRPPPVSILGQPNPAHTPTSHLLEIRPNIIHPSKPRSPQWSLSLRFPHQDPIHPPLPFKKRNNAYLQEEVI